MKRSNVLIVGCSGFLGSHLSESTTILNAFDVTTAARSTGDLRIDLTDPRTLATVRDHLKKRSTHYVIIAAAITDVEACASNPKQTRAINVEGTFALLDEIKRAQSVPIFFSSDYALEPVARLTLLNEESPVQPQTEYGKQKAAVEKYLRENFGKYLIFRTSKLMSRTPHPKSILQAIIRPLTQNQDIRPFHDQWMTPVFVEDIAEVLAHPKLTNLSGTFHLATKRVFTRNELTRLIRDQYLPQSRSQITPMSLTEIPTLEKRPHYNTLDASKIAEALDFRFREIEEELPAVLDLACR